jgi:AraC-like DNA-binding protein
MSEIILANWEAIAEQPLDVRVVPDGCRDLILCLAPGAAPHWFISDLDDQTRVVRMDPGVRLVGFRLRPGTAWDEDRLPAVLAEMKPDPDDAAQRIHDLANRHAAVSEALDCLASGAASVAGSAGDLGISPRTLQRLVMGSTGRSPAFWLLLARARRSARAVLEGASLADAAYQHGYADQAHMSREFRRWFDVSPRRLARDAEIARQLLQPGYA